MPTKWNSSLTAAVCADAKATQYGTTVNVLVFWGKHSDCEGARGGNVALVTNKRQST